MGFRTAIVPMEPSERVPDYLRPVGHVHPLPSVDGMKVFGSPDVHSALLALKLYNSEPGPRPASSPGPGPGP